MSNILAFDTSNYTTSVCLFNTENGLVWENRIMLPVTSGKCGLRQSEAVFLHNRNLNSLLKDFPNCKIDAVAASCCPSERVDSYMPCFTVGVSFASAVSSILSVPMYTCSHQKNHIGAAIYSSNTKEILNNDFFAFHISGGTTDILHCMPENKKIKVIKVGGSADISCGQLIDRAGVALGLPFPCGQHIENYASGNISANIKIFKNKFDYNFSGFENKVKNMIDDSKEKTQICDYVLDVVTSFVYDSIVSIRTMYKDTPIILSGGVMSNKYISQFITDKFDNVYFAEHKYSTDGALGTAFMCCYEGGLFDE